MPVCHRNRLCLTIKKDKRMNRRLPFRLGIVVVVLYAAYWAYGAFVHSGGGQPQMPAFAVSVQEAAPADIPLTFEYAGRAVGSREVEIRARVSGILQKRSYVEGAWVKEGDELFKIDPAPFQAALAQAQARYNQAERDWQRVSALFKEKAVSTREYDEARSAHDQAQAALKTAQIDLGYTTVTAPISGVTSKEGLSEGSLVTADSSLLTRLTQLDPMYVEFAYPDTEILNLRQQISQNVITLPDDQKLRAEIHFGDGSVYKQEGVIDFTDSIIDTQTGTVRARATVPNPDGNIYPGQFVRVVVKGFTRRSAITVPDKSVMQGPQGPFVFTVDAEGKAAITPITLGRLVDDRRIAESGLKAGDKVIVEGMIKTRPGSPVTIAPPSAAQAEEPAPQESAQATDSKEAH